jgi:kynurenine formamidase
MSHFAKLYSNAATLSIILTLATAFTGCQTHRVAFNTVVDLTHPMFEGMPYWPTGVPFTKTRVSDYPGSRVHSFEMGENTGTHIDAPAHFVPGKRNIDELTLDELVLPAVVIELQDEVENNHDYLMTPEDIYAWEKKHGKIPADSMVIFNSGWFKRFSVREDYWNMDEDGVMHYPGFHPDCAAIFLERDVAGVGIDTLSLDNGPSPDFAFHHLILGEDKYMIENLANRDALPPTGATLVVGVLPIKEGSQAQARIFALLR